MVMTDDPNELIEWVLAGFSLTLIDYGSCMIHFPLNRKYESKVLFR